MHYENLLTTAELTADDLLAIMAEDTENNRSDRNLTEFAIEERAGKKVLLHAGKPAADPIQRFTIAFNSYDGQSGGGRLKELHRRTSAPEAKRKPTDIETREALIAWLGRK